MRWTEVEGSGADLQMHCTLNLPLPDTANSWKLPPLLWMLNWVITTYLFPPKHLIQKAKHCVLSLFLTLTPFPTRTLLSLWLLFGNSFYFSCRTILNTGCTGLRLSQNVSIVTRIRTASCYTLCRLGETALVLNTRRWTYSVDFCPFTGMTTGLQWKANLMRSLCSKCVCCASCL